MLRPRRRSRSMFPILDSARRFRSVAIAVRLNDSRRLVPCENELEVSIALHDTRQRLMNELHLLYQLFWRRLINELDALQAHFRKGFAGDASGVHLAVRIAENQEVLDSMKFHSPPEFQEGEHLPLERLVREKVLVQIARGNDIDTLEDWQKLLGECEAAAVDPFLRCVRDDESPAQTLRGLEQLPRCAGDCLHSLRSPDVEAGMLIDERRTKECVIPIEHDERLASRRPKQRPTRRPAEMPLAGGGLPNAARRRRRRQSSRQSPSGVILRIVHVLCSLLAARLAAGVATCDVGVFPRQRPRRGSRVARLFSLVRRLSIQKTNPGAAECRAEHSAHMPHRRAVPLTSGPKTCDAALRGTFVDSCWARRRRRDGATCRVGHAGGHVTRPHCRRMRPSWNARCKGQALLSNGRARVAQLDQITVKVTVLFTIDVPPGEKVCEPCPHVERHAKAYSRHRGLMENITGPA
mmetsp:Transcript_73466/g.204090  ORF Transcript_73466/g.204090 Transcript_73466/m.204090 type:complete len:466 (+) Transcript_73466:576-1973(+)